MVDLSVPSEDLGAGNACCFLYDPNSFIKSRGIDFEATGEILPGWQIAASYNHNTNEQEGSFYAGSEGQPFTSIQPKNLYKLWTSYDFGASHRAGYLSGLTVSGGIHGQSSAYYAGTTCVNPIDPPPPAGNSSTCISSGPPDMVPFSFTVPGYFVASALVEYRLTPKWSFALNVDNIFDKTYYQSVGSGTNGGNWYGAPRSFTATLRAKW
jgi:outer membrane receptor for ferric coprogen and ferric-rhodotorulic acid